MQVCVEEKEGIADGVHNICEMLALPAEILGNALT
jgi:hypothetical protein